MERGRIGMQLTRLLVVLWLFFSQMAFAEYILTAPPREDPSQGIALYGPLADKLSSLLEEPVKYEQASNWADYAKKMRQGRYDIVFDGPHFVGWRQRHLQHIPVAQLPGDLDFYLVTRQDATSIKNPRHLIGKNICGMPSPNLGTNLVFKLYENPVLLPTIYEVDGGQQKTYEAFKAGHCDAIIFGSAGFKKLPEAERSTLKIIAKTQSVPNQTFSISPRLNAKREIIETFLNSKDGAIAASELLDLYSKQAKYFTKPNTENYSAAADILEGVVWGW